MNKPIDIFLGTKAQYIKTAPLMRLMQEKGVPYHLIDSGQHAEFSAPLRRELGVRDPDVILADRGNITTVFAALLWALRLTFLTIFRPRNIRRYFSGQSTYCVIHGDTPTTLLSLMMAKRAGKKVAHLEAGLRSFNIWRPFPEELIRIVCMRFSDVLFVPSEWAEQNLRDMAVKGEIINIGHNTGLEAMYYALEKSDARATTDRHSYCLATVHRVETILRSKRLEFVIQALEEIALTTPVKFIMHGPTQEKLKQFGMIDRIENNPDIEVSPLVPHGEFLQLLEGARFAISDGGSIQEEASYLGTPCLIMRSETERQEGLGANVVLGHFSKESIMGFFAEADSLRRDARAPEQKPSAIVLKALTRSEPD